MIVNQVRQRSLLKRMVKRLKGLRQNSFQTARWCQTTVVGPGREALHEGTFVFGLANERSQTDSAGVAAQPYAASSAATRLQMTKTNQTINHLGQVILREFILIGDFANGKGLVSTHGGEHQHTKRVIGKAGEHHTKEIARPLRWGHRGRSFRSSWSECSA